MSRLSRGHRSALLAAALWALTWGAGCSAGETGSTTAGERRSRVEFEIDEAVWLDTQRGREVPVRITRPLTTQDPAALLIYSHGAGGTRDGGTYLAEHLAARGYVVLAVQHAGSDRAALGRPITLGKSLRAMVEDPANLEARPLDVRFVLDRALQPGALGVAVDARRIGVLGHSFGAYTAMAVAGLLVDLPGRTDTSLRDARVGAVLALSPQGTGTMGIGPGAWDAISIPVMLLTGTADKSFAQPWTWRREPFEALAASERVGPTYLGVLADGTHLSFGDEQSGILEGLSRRDPRHHGWIQLLATDFFDAHLCGDAAALARLDAHAIEDASAGQLTLSMVP